MNQSARRVLVIDDSKTIHAVLTAFLSERGWVVETFFDGESGASAAFQQPPDAVICDQSMGGISGIQLCRLLREDPRTATIPVVILTATTTKQGQFWAMESGASGYVAKTAIATLVPMIESLKAIPKRVRRTSAPDTAHLSVSQRLGHLLDSSLFDAMLKNKFMAIATASDSTATLFASVAELLASVLSVQWIALSVTGEPKAFLLCRPGDQSAELEARSALQLDTRSELETTQSDRCVLAGPERTRAVRPLVFAEQAIGRLVLELSHENLSAQDHVVVDIAEQQIPVGLQLVRLIEQTTKLAMTDALTGISNRRCGVDNLERALSASSRHGTPLCIAMVDVDHFKSVNDRFGHDGGDVVLKAVASILSRSIRRSDTVARWGGEEFLLLFPQTARQGTLLVCERLRQVIAGRSLDTATGAKLTVTASIGVAVAAESDTAESLLRRADDALYQAKNSGRNRVVGPVDES